MKNKSMLFAFAGIITLMLILPVVNADMIMPGTKSIPYCARITNLADYPDYTFLLYYESPMGNSFNLIRDDGCLGLGYKFSTNSVYAIEKSKFDSSKIIVSDITSLSGGYNLSINDTNLIDLDYKIWGHNYVSVPLSSPETSINETLRIENINGKLSVSKTVETHYSFFNQFLILMFFLTFIIELFVVWAFVKGSFWRVVLWAFIINLITWPLANLAIAFGAGWTITEFFVFLAEGFLIMGLFKTNWKKAFLTSFAANLASALIGLILFGFL